MEKGNLEVLLFTLQSRMRANNQKPYTPKEGKMISDINKAWERLEKAEHERYATVMTRLLFIFTYFVRKTNWLFFLSPTNDPLVLEVMLVESKSDRY